MLIERCGISLFDRADVFVSHFRELILTRSL
jgi:hypothetical protein